MTTTMVAISGTTTTRQKKISITNLGVAKTFQITKAKHQVIEWKSIKTNFQLLLKAKKFVLFTYRPPREAAVKCLTAHLALFRCYQLEWSFRLILGTDWNLYRRRCWVGVVGCEWEALDVSGRLQDVICLRAVFGTGASVDCALLKKYRSHHVNWRYYPVVLSAIQCLEKSLPTVPCLELILTGIQCFEKNIWQFSLA